MIMKVYKAQDEQGLGMYKRHSLVPEPAPRP